MDGFLDSRSAGWIRLRDVVRKSGDEILNVLCSAFLIGSDCKKKNEAKSIFRPSHHWAIDPGYATFRRQLRYGAIENYPILEPFQNCDTCTWVVFGDLSSVIKGRRRGLLGEYLNEIYEFSLILLHASMKLIEAEHPIVDYYVAGEHRVCP